MEVFNRNIFAANSTDFIELYPHANLRAFIFRMKMLHFVQDVYGGGPYTNGTCSSDVKLAARPRASLGSDYGEGTCLSLTGQQYAVRA
jgi:hypothetical protein